MAQVILEVPDEMLQALKLRPDRLREELLMAAAVKLYELGTLSSGAAALLAGIPVPVFLGKLATTAPRPCRTSGAELREDAQRA